MPILLFKEKVYHVPGAVLEDGITLTLLDEGHVSVMCDMIGDEDQNQLENIERAIVKAAESHFGAATFEDWFSFEIEEQEAGKQDGS